MSDINQESSEEKKAEADVSSPLNVEKAKVEDQSRKSAYKARIAAGDGRVVLEQAEVDYYIPDPDKRSAIGLQLDSMWGDNPALHAACVKMLVSEQDPEAIQEFLVELYLHFLRANPDCNPWDQSVDWVRAESGKSSDCPGAQFLINASRDLQADGRPLSLWLAIQDALDNVRVSNDIDRKAQERLREEQAGGQ